MTRPAEHPGAARLSVMVQLVGSVCAVLLALSLALAATLLREGHFAACIENSGYLDTLHTAVLDTCGGYAAAAGTTADPLADIITPEAVRARGCCTGPTACGTAAPSMRRTPSMTSS